ncbi:MAG TPA: LbtU family siderophore porin [Gammaproteobacteria bacterium]|jgi:hypothetical protein|nr:LbtU family siderophore porin [Gammaproteobacteria bacterium]
MKVKIKKVTALLCSAGLVSFSVSAIAATNASVQKQLDQLRSQVASLQAQVKHNQHYAGGGHTNAHKKHHLYLSGATENSDGTTDKDTQKLTALELRHLIREETEYLPFDLDVPGQAFVSTGPYVGVPIQFAGSNLIVNTPSVNTDVQLLEIRKEILTQLDAMGGEIAREPYHSHLLLSGLLESQVRYINNSAPHNNGTPSTNINVSSVSIDFTVLGPSDWLLGFVELGYEDSPPNGSPYSSTSSYTVSNSRLFINKAFVTLGDFAVSPYYGSIGQFYVPFGTYSSFLLSEVLTKQLTRTKARSIALGFQEQAHTGFYGAAYIFRGDSHAQSIDRVNNGGLNLGYKLALGPLSGKVGGGVIANIADSGGMQVANGTGFSHHEQIVHRVPGYNLRTNLDLGGHLDFIAEYVGASTNFNPNDMSFNGRGAKPWAVDTEMSYSFTMLDNKPTAVGIGYAHTAEALALGLPQSRYSIAMNTSLLRNTLESIEYRHDRGYPSKNTATGADDSAGRNSNGGSDNAVTAQLDYYF